MMNGFSYRTTRFYLGRRIGIADVIVNGKCSAERAPHVTIRREIPMSNWLIATIVQPDVFILCFSRIIDILRE